MTRALQPIPLAWSDLACTALAAVGLWYVAGFPAAPYEVTDWTWAALGVGGLLSLVSGQTAQRRAALIGSALLGWSVLALFVLQPLLVHQWSTGEALCWLGLVVSAGAGTAWATVEGTRLSVPGVCAFMALWALSIAVVLAGTGSLLLGALALTAAVPALLCAGLAASSWGAGRVTLLPVLVLAQLCLVGGVVFASTPHLVGAWLLWAPISLVGLPREGYRAWRAGLAGLAVALGALFGTWWLAWR